jgi:hypothetical protein
MLEEMLEEMLVIENDQHCDPKAGASAPFQLASLRGMSLCPTIDLIDDIFGVVVISFILTSDPSVKIMESVISTLGRKGATSHSLYVVG